MLEKCKRYFFLLILFLVLFALALPMAQAATLTYNNNGGLGNNDWANTVDWTTGSVAGQADNALITANVAEISSGIASVNSADLSNGAIWDSSSNGLTLTVATLATFHDTSFNQSGTINGNTTFNDSSYNQFGTINGNATFNNTSSNLSGTINGNATFNGASYNQSGTINGNAVLNGTSYNQYGTINGNATFDTTWYSAATAPLGGVFTVNGNNYWSGDVTGVVYGADHQAITSYVFNNSSYNYAGTINGNAAFNNTSYNQNGTINGSVVFNSTADQSGTINAGSGSVSGNFSTSAGITFESGTVLSDISGTGGFSKTGNGAVTLSGSSSYSGGTIISAGTLQVENASALGTGAVINNAKLNVGTTNLILAGAYTQNTGSALGLTVGSPSIYGGITSAVAASVAGASAINVTVSGSIAKGTTFTVINTQGQGIVLTGGLPTVTSSASRAHFTDAYINDNLVLTEDYFTGDFASLGDNANSRAVGGVINNMTNPSADMTTILNTLGPLSNAQITQAFNTMGPVIDGGVVQDTTSSFNNLISTTIDRVHISLNQGASGTIVGKDVSIYDESAQNGIWASPYGSYLVQGDMQGVQGYNAWNAGTVIGLDRMITDSFTLGISGGYAYGQVSSDANNATANINSAQGTVYAGYMDPTLNYFIDAAGSFAWNWYDGQREIMVGDINRTADANYNGRQYGTYLDSGYKFYLGDTLELTPLASVQWTHLNVPSYKETNAGALNLNVDKQNYDDLESGIGASIACPIQFGWGKLTPELHAKWLYDYIDDRMVVTSSFAGGGVSFTSYGANPSREGLNVGGKLSFNIYKDLSLVAAVDSELKDQFFSVFGSGTVRYKF